VRDPASRHDGTIPDVTWAILIPIILLATLLVLTLTLFVLSRVKGGRYLRPVVQLLSKIPFMRRWFQRMSIAAYERTNPDLANAIKKMQKFGEPTTPEQAQRLMQLLTPAERKAYLAAVGGQADLPAATNREQRRRVERGAQGMIVQQRPGAAGKRPKKRR
jgi:hypothetical protein